MIKLRRRAKLNKNSIPPLQPALEVRFNVRGGGGKTLCSCGFRPFSLSEWKHEIVLSLGVDTCHAVLDAVSQEQTILPLSKGEDRMLNERKRINSILGEGSSCRVASAMLNLFQYLTNMKEELLAKKTFTPQHLASLACNLFTNKILNQVQDDITKNSHENFPFTPSEKVRCKNLCIQAWHNNSNVKERCKSLCIQAWHLNSNMKGGDKICLA